MNFIRLMLSLKVADVIAYLFYMVTDVKSPCWWVMGRCIASRYYIGRCLCRLMLCLLSIGLMLCPLADVIAILYNHRRFRADVIALDWLWLMLLPSGRWNGYRVNYNVCDRQMLWPLGGYYFSFSSELFNRTSSRICGRWYLPIFLFRDGLFTLI